MIPAAMGSRRRFDSNVYVVAAGDWRCTTLRRLVSIWNGDCWSSLVVCGTRNDCDFGLGMEATTFFFNDDFESLGRCSN